MSKKATLEEAKRTFADNGMKLLAMEYVNNRTLMPYICLKHEDKGIQYKSLENVKTGKKCKYCGIKKKAKSQSLDFVKVKKAFEDVGLQIVSPPEDYKNVSSRLKYICPKHPNVIQETTYNSVRQGHGCYLCSKESMAKKESFNYKFVKQEFNKRGYELLSTEYINCKEYLEYRCLKHPEHVQKITFDAFNRGQGCRFCGVQKRAQKNRVSEQRAKAQCSIVGLEYIGFDFSQGATRVLYICPHHRQNGVQSISWDNLKIGHGCKFCKESKGEKIIDTYLQKHNLQYIREYRFDDCEYKRTLPFDFYLKDINVVIEFDGEQHYKLCTFGGKNNKINNDNFKETQIRDKIKTQYCKEHNIKLIRIPYWDINNIETILNKELNIHKI